MSRPDDPKVDELVTAYVDGVGELSPEDRRRIEARLAEDPSARGDAEVTRTLLAELRALPPEGEAADWGELARSIRSAVAPLPIATPWWRRWTWFAPAGAIVLAAALLFWLHATTATDTPAPRDQAPAVAIAPSHPAAAPQPPSDDDDDDTSLVWLDGQAVDVGDVDPGALAAPAGADTIATEAIDPAGDPVIDPTSGLLPAPDLGWVDQLDDRALDRAERYLAGSKG